jgi:hypothetical protein
MSWDVHGMETEDGPRFKVWSTVSDGYVTGELDENELKAFYLEGELVRVERNARSAGREPTKRELQEVEERFDSWWTPGRFAALRGGSVFDPNEPRTEWDEELGL